MRNLIPIVMLLCSFSSCINDLEKVESEKSTFKKLNIVNHRISGLQSISFTGDYTGDIFFKTPSILDDKYLPMQIQISLENDKQLKYIKLTEPVSKYLRFQFLKFLDKIKVRSLDESIVKSTLRLQQGKKKKNEARNLAKYTWSTYVNHTNDISYFNGTLEQDTVTNLITRLDLDDKTNFSKITKGNVLDFNRLKTLLVNDYIIEGFNSSYSLDKQKTDSIQSQSFSPYAFYLKSIEEKGLNFSSLCCSRLSKQLINEFFELYFTKNHLYKEKIAPIITYLTVRNRGIRQHMIFNFEDAISHDKQTAEVEVVSYVWDKEKYRYPTEIHIIQKNQDNKLLTDFKIKIRYSHFSY